MTPLRWSFLLFLSLLLTAFLEGHSEEVDDEEEDEDLESVHVLKDATFDSFISWKERAPRR